jgi:hypothetical protein
VILGTSKRRKMDYGNRYNRRFTIIENRWEKSVALLRKRGRLTKKEENRLLGGNFAIAILRTRRGKNKYRTRLFTASSRISYPVQHNLLNHKETQAFYQHMVYHTPGTTLNYDYIAVDTNRNIIEGSPRKNDTEAKIIEHVSKIISNPLYNEIELHLYTAFEPCLSCDTVIVQFLKNYPKVNLFLYSKWAYNETIYPVKER